MIDEFAPRSHYHFRISLRVRHPYIAPEEITEALGIDPKRSWKAGEPRSTPKGTALAGSNRDTYWTAEVAADRWPSHLSTAVHDTLGKLVAHRSSFIASAPKAVRQSCLSAGSLKTKAAMC